MGESNISFPHTYLYLLGITSLFIASKFEEVEAISISMIVREIGHNQYTEKEVLQMEKKILTNIFYRIPVISFYEETHILLTTLQKESEEKLD